MATRTVGPGKQFSRIRDAINASVNGDIIEVDGGRTYPGDGGQINGKHLTIRAVETAEGRFAHIEGQVTNDKGFFVCGSGGGLTLEWFHLEGASEDGSPYNAAGVRMDQGSGDLTLRNCFFERNGNGVLCGVNSGSTYTVQHCEFYENGHPNGGAGTHHFYCNDAAELLVEDCLFWRITNWYNQIKSRAQKTTVRRTRVLDVDGRSGYSIDCPDGGEVLIEDCVVHQNNNPANAAIFTFGVEGGLVKPVNTWTIRNCVVINDYNGGSFLNKVGSPPVTLQNVQVYRITTALSMPSGSGVTSTNVTFPAYSSRPALDTTTKPYEEDGGTEPPPPTGGNTLTVGSGKQYSTLTAALNAAVTGDTILVDAGTYDNQFTGDGLNKNVTIKGVGGFAHFRATVPVQNGSQQKGYFVLNQGGTFEWCRFSGCGNGVNGAAIRYQGGDLVLKNCWVHNNENGILAATANGTITLERCEFHDNSISGSTHHFYANNLTKVTATSCYFHHLGSGGNQFKSRALETVLTNCRFFDWDGDSNYSVDCPDGGKLTMTNCIIQQGAVGSNRNVIDLGAENPTTNPSPQATVTGCTLINDNVDGATFFWNNTSGACALSNNRLFAAPGTAAITVTNGSNITVSGTTNPSTRPFMDTSHPWDSAGSAGGVGTAVGVSAAVFPGVNRRSTSTVAYDTDQTTIVIPKPAGAPAGDRLLLAIVAGRYSATAATITAPAGWSAIGTNPHSDSSDSTPYTTALYLFYKNLGAGEPASYTFTPNTAVDFEAFCYSVTGHDAAQAPKVSTDSEANDGGPSVANSVTVTNNFGLAVHFNYCWNNASESTPPTNYVERYEGTILYVADRSVNAGPTGTTSAQHNLNIGGGGFDFWGAAKVVIEAPATGGGGTIVARAGSAAGVGSASATGRTIKGAAGSSSGAGAVAATTSGAAFGTAFGFGDARGVSAGTAASAGLAQGRGSATAFAADPGAEDPGIITPGQASTGKTLIAYGNWADDSIYSGGGWRGTLPLSNLGTKPLGQLARSVSADPVATQFTVDIGRNRPARVVALLNHNIRFASTYRLIGSNSPDFQSVGVDTGPQPVWPTVYPMAQRAWEADNFWFGTYTLDDVKGYPWHLIIVLSGTKWLRYWRLEIEDPSNPDGYVQAGRLFIGDAWEPEEGIPFGASLGWEDPTTLVETLSGAEYADPRPPFRVARITTQMMSTDEAYGRAFEIQRRSGISKEILYIHDTNDTLHQIRRRFPARLRVLGPTENPYPDAHQTPWEAKEILP